MKLVKVELKDFNSMGYRKTKLDEVIDEFIAMNTAVVKLYDWQEIYASTSSCTNAYNTAIKRKGYKHIKATTRNGIPYLINMDLMDKEV